MTVFLVCNSDTDRIVMGPFASETIAEAHLDRIDLAPRKNLRGASILTRVPESWRDAFYIEPVELIDWMPTCRKCQVGVSSDGHGNLVSQDDSAGSGQECSAGGTHDAR